MFKLLKQVMARDIRELAPVTPLGTMGTILLTKLVEHPNQARPSPLLPALVQAAAGAALAAPGPCMLLRARVGQANCPQLGDWSGPRVQKSAICCLLVCKTMRFALLI